MPTLSPPETNDPTDELDALIEEARSRARRRRLITAALIAAAALAVGAGLFFFGGDDGGGTPGAGDSGDLGNAGLTGEGKSSASAAYRCPTSPAELRAGPPRGSAIPGCRVTFSADLPEGWDQRPSALTVFPVGARSIALEAVRATRPFRRTNPTFVRGEAAGGIAMLIGAREVKFANFRLSDPLRPGADVVPGDGVIVSLTHSHVASDDAPTELQFEPEDFRTSAPRPRAVAVAPLALDGLVFDVRVELGTETPSADLLGEANAVVASLTTTQKLCPCGDQPVIHPIRATLRNLDEERRVVDELRPTDTG